jgi:glycosyltransferase involved in cell wall biosynthesis
MSELDVLFVHNNFPAQFRNLAGAMAKRAGVRVRAIGAKGAPGLPEVPLQRYSFAGSELANVHSFARRFELESRRAEQVIYAATTLKYDGFAPKLIYVHPGWGEALPLRALFPDATICSYAEFYYWPSGTDIGFDKDAPRYGVDGETRVILRNAATLLSLTEANFAVAPTHWQRRIFPREMQPKIHVVHDGLDTEKLVPGPPPARFSVSGQSFEAGDEVVTFVSRNLEPYRGFHIVMRALPEILKARPKARICLVGGDGVSYGSAPTDHPSWKAALLTELGDKLDLSRVHFLGKVAYGDYLNLLRLSSAHIYLTYPFVLSWSMLEAMALGCLVIGSATAPVEEVIQDGVNGLLVPFFQTQVLAERVIEALTEPERFRHLRSEAHATIRARYDFERHSWPTHLKLIDEFVFSAPLVAALREPAVGPTPVPA